MKKQECYYSEITKCIYTTLDEAEQAEAKEKVCGYMIKLIKRDKEEGTDQYFFEPHKTGASPLECWVLLLDTMGLTWKDVLNIIENKSK